MGLIAISGQPGCRFEEVARLSAQRSGFELLTGSRMASLMADEFGDTAIPDRAYPDVVASVVTRLATDHHLAFAGDDADLLFQKLPGLLRVLIDAPEAVRIGNLMVDRRLERPAARELLRQLEAERRALRKARFGKTTMAAHDFDLVLNAAALQPEQMADVVLSMAETMGLARDSHLPAAAEAQLQFQIRMRLAKHGIVPAGKVGLTASTKLFVHPSEQIFANLLDFYRIPWEYEPRSFPIQWDNSGNVAEAFTPDFYLPEFDLYVELTTMKQSLVTKKNRKIRLLRQIYPHVNIQVFYQKDIENLIFKYGLAGRLTHA